MSYFKPRAIDFLKKALGEEGFESLEKFEIFKKKTNTVVDPEEIKIALQIVPKTILSLLQSELSQMKENEGKRVKLPVEPEATLDITKHSNDVYSGDIVQSGKIVTTFKNRTLPSVGLVIMTSFELYDLNDLDRINLDLKSDKALNIEKEIEKAIDERFKIQDLVSKLVDKKISERDAIEEVVKMKMSKLIFENSANAEGHLKEKVKKSQLKLKEFLNKTNSKKAKIHNIKIEKSEKVTCPDCGKKIFDQSGFSGCVCFGPDMNKKIFLTKAENGVKISFSNSWDPENIEMLLQIIREKRNRGGA